MQKFHFKLQPLLNKERIYEDECIGRLRTVQDRFQKEKSTLENLKKCKLNSQSMLKSKKRQEMSSEELRVYEDYFLKLGSSINVCKFRIREISKELNAIREELNVIVKKRKALEKLRERWEYEYKSNLAFISNKEIDDIAITKFVNQWVAEND